MAALGPIRDLFESVEDKLEGIADLFEDEDRGGHHDGP